MSLSQSFSPPVWTGNTIDPNGYTEGSATPIGIFEVLVQLYKLLTKLAGTNINHKQIKTKQQNESIQDYKQIQRQKKKTHTQTQTQTNKQAFN